MHKYAVVEFVAEGSVDVVATSWIFCKEGHTFCRWPPAAQFNHAVRKCEPASTSWAYYKCRQLYSTGLCNVISTAVVTSIAIIIPVLL